MRRVTVILLGCLLAACAEKEASPKLEVNNSPAVELPSEILGDKAKWESLFSGHDLQGWIPKFTESVVGENVLDTFRAENGVLSVDYGRWDKLDGRYGHLFTEKAYSHYILKLEYRFIGEQLEAGPFMGWAKRNNGAMLHSQSASSMGLDQQFPVSIEAQLLGGLSDEERGTGNLCTPGTHVVMDEELITEHCISSELPALQGDQWVQAEFEVLGSGRIRHFINGDLVMEYHQPQYDTSSPEAVKLQAEGGLLINRGHIALQAESHPTQFRNIVIHQLNSNEKAN